MDAVAELLVRNPKITIEIAAKGMAVVFVVKGETTQEVVELQLWEMARESYNIAAHEIGNAIRLINNRESAK